MAGIAYHAMRYKLPLIESQQSAQVEECLIDHEQVGVQIVPGSCEVRLTGEVASEDAVAQVEYCAQTYVAPWRKLNNQLKIAGLSPKVN